MAHIKWSLSKSGLITRPSAPGEFRSKPRKAGSRGTRRIVHPQRQAVSRAAPREGLDLVKVAGTNAASLGIISPRRCFGGQRESPTPTEGRTAPLTALQKLSLGAGLPLRSLQKNVWNVPCLCVSSKDDGSATCCARTASRTKGFDICVWEPGGGIQSYPKTLAVRDKSVATTATEERILARRRRGQNQGKSSDQRDERDCLRREIGLASSEMKTKSRITKTF